MYSLDAIVARNWEISVVLSTVEPYYDGNEMNDTGEVWTSDIHRKVCVDDDTLSN